MVETPKEITITKLSSHTGAEVRGVDLTRPLQPAECERLYRAFVERSVLVIRGQRLDAPQFLAAMRNFGEIFPQHNSRFAVPAQRPARSSSPAKIGRVHGQRPIDG